MITKALTVVTLTVLVFCAVVSCGPSGGPVPPTPTPIPPTPTPVPPAITGNTPEGVILRFLSSIEKQDANAYLDSLDPALRDQPGYFFGAQLMQAALSVFGIEIGGASEVSFRDLQLQTLDSSDTIAHLTVSGKVRSVAFAQEYPLNMTVTTRKIDGTWYVSSEEVIAPAAPKGPMRIIPVALEKGDPSGGWVNYAIELVIENVSDQLLYDPVLPEEHGVVNTSEGVTYEAVLCSRVLEGDYSGQCLEPEQILSWYHWALPPKFRSRGIAEAFDYAITFRTAEAAHPVSVDMPSLGTIDLQNISALVMPVDSEVIDESWLRIGDRIEVHGRYVFSIADFDTCSFGDFCGTFTAKNLDAFNETVAYLLYCSIDDAGWIEDFPVRLDSANYYPAIHLPLGPNQTEAEVLRFTGKRPSYIVVWGDIETVVVVAVR